MTGFDVDAWLDEAAPPTRAVKIYGRGDIVAQLQVAQAVREDQSAAALIDERLGGAPPTNVAPIAPGLLADLEASARMFIVRGLLDGEARDALARSTKTDESGEKYVDEPWNELLLAVVALVDPVVTVEQAGRLRERIGQGQWDALFTAIGEATREPIDVPLSRLGSGTGKNS